ncbi:MAG: TetR/AcrR family transcriptional regulator [Paracoccaceae bacterium]|jgi:AcrR family transcriptional regulator
MTDEKQIKLRLPPQERKAQFINKAIEFFSQEGFDSSTRQLAAKLNVTQPLLYRYFPSKDDLINQVYEAVYMGRWDDNWDKLLRDQSKSLEERLNIFYQQYTAKVFEDKWLRIFLFSGLKGIEINKRYLKFVQENVIQVIGDQYLKAYKPQQLRLTDREQEIIWVTHGSLIYYGIRKHVYGSGVFSDTFDIIESSIRGMLAQLS